jgi:hypothetical protein
MGFSAPRLNDGHQRSEGQRQPADSGLPVSTFTHRFPHGRRFLRSEYDTNHDLLPSVGSLVFGNSHTEPRKGEENLSGAF